MYSPILWDTIPFSSSVLMPPESPHVGRLINHSKGAANSKTLSLDVGGRPRIYLAATRAKSTGEELLYDYKERVLDTFTWLKENNIISNNRVGSARVFKLTGVLPLKHILSSVY